MKKLLAIIICLMLVAPTALAGCGKKEAEVKRPVIEISTDDLDQTVNFVSKWAIPTARCKSVADKKRLDVIITATKEAGGDAVVENGYLKPDGLGKYSVHYNATDVDEAHTKANEVILNVTFVDNGPEIKAKRGTSSLQNISDFTEYVIPEFDDIADLSYDLKGWTNEDFESTKTATYTPAGSEMAQEITDLTTPTVRKEGVINVKYTLTPKADSSKSYTYDFVVQIGNVLLVDMKDRGEGYPVEITSIEVPEISDSPIVRLAAPYPVEDFQWPGAKIKDSGILDMLNKSSDQVLVLNCYNPTQYWGKFYFDVYDDDEYTGIKGCYGRKYRVAPHSYFQMTVPKNIHKGNVNILEIVIEDCWPLTDENTLPEDVDQEKPEPNTGGWHGSEIYILSAEIAIEDETISEQVWDDKEMPLLKAYKTPGSNEESTDATVEKYTSDTLNGIKVTANKQDAPVEPETPAQEGDAETPGQPEEKPVGNDVYIDFLSDESRNQFIMDNFADVRREHKYDRSFAFKVTNIGTEPLNVWAILGNGSNQKQDNSNGTRWLYDLVIDAGETKDIYYDATTRNDEYDVDSALNCMYLSTNQINAEFVISDVRIVKYPQFKKDIPEGKLEINKKAEAHTDKALTVLPDTDWTLPAFDSLYSSNYEVTGEIEKVTYKKAAEDVAEVIDGSKAVRTKRGYYTISYKATEVTSGDVYKFEVTFICKAPFDALERVGADKVAAFGEHYNVPEFDTMFAVEEDHAAKIQSVTYRKSADAEFTATEDFRNGVIYTNPGEYKITYFVNSLVDEKTAEVSYILTVQSGLELDMFAVDPEKTLDTTTGLDGKPAVIFDPANWDRVYYDNAELINDFNNSENAVLYIRGKNISDKKTYICAFMDDMDVPGVDSDGVPLKHARFICEYPEAGEEFLIALPSSSVKLIADGRIRLAVASNEETHTTVGKIAITEVGLAYDDDFTATKVVEENQATADRFTALGATTTVENGKLKITASEKEVELPLWTNENNAILREAFENNADEKFFAVDVTNDSDADGEIQLGMGVNGSSIDWLGTLKTQVVPAHSTRTIYVYVGMMARALSMNKVNAASINYLGLTVGDNTNWFKSGSMSYSNFRIVDFSNTTKFEISKKAEAHTESALNIKPNTSWQVPQFADMYNVNGEYDVSVSASYRATPSAEAVEVDAKNAITTKTGYYNVVYKVTETATGKTYTRNVTFVALGDFEAMEKADLDKVLAYGEKYTIPEFDTLFDLKGEHTSSVKSIEYRANETADWNLLEMASEILAKGGQYKITYNYEEVAEPHRSLDIAIILNGQAKLEADKFSVEGKATVTAVDYNGKPAVKYVTEEGWTRLKLNNRDLIEAFNNAGNDAFLVVNCVNLGEPVYVCGFLGDLVAVDPNGMNHKAVPAKDEEFSLILPREVRAFKDADSLGNIIHIQLADVGAIAVLGFELVYETSENAENILTVDESLVETVKANAILNGGTAEYSTENGEIFISTTSSNYIWQLNTDAFPTAKAGFDKFIAGRNHMAIAIDVRNTTDSKKVLWLGMGRGANENINGDMREQIIPANTTRTIYLTNSMLKYEDPPFGGIANYIHINMSGDSGKLGFSNFRVIDFGTL